MNGKLTVGVVSSVLEDFAPLISFVVSDQLNTIQGWRRLLLALLAKLVLRWVCEGFHGRGAMLRRVGAAFHGLLRHI